MPRRVIPYNNAGDNIRCRTCDAQKPKCFFISFEENPDLTKIEYVLLCATCRNRTVISRLLTKYGADENEEAEEAIQMAVYFNMDNRMSAFYTAFQHLVAEEDITTIWQGVHNDSRLTKAALYFQDNATKMGSLLPLTPPGSASSTGFLRQEQGQSGNATSDEQEQNGGTNRPRVLSSEERYHDSPELVSGDIATPGQNLRNLVQRNRRNGTWKVVEAYMISVASAMKSAYRHAQKAEHDAEAS